MRKSGMVLALVLMLCLLLLPIACHASDALLVEGLQRFGADKLLEDIPEGATELAEQSGLGELSFSEILHLTPSNLFHAVQISLVDALHDARSALFAVIGTVLLCALLSVCGPSGASSPVFEMVAVLAVTTSLCTPVINCVRDAASAIVETSMFLLSYVPIYSTVLTAGGQPLSAAGYSVAVMGMAQLTSQLAAQLLIPICGVYLALCLAGAVGKNAGLLHLSSSIKKLINWSLTLAMTLFVGVLTLQSFMSGAADGVAVKTTKFLIGTFVPVVGGAISEALLAAQGSIHLIKATVGSFGIAVAVLSFLPVLMRVVILRAVIAIAAMVGETLGTSQVREMLNGFSNVMAVLTALLLSMALLVIISTAVMLSAGGSAI